SVGVTVTCTWLVSFEASLSVPTPTGGLMAVKEKAVFVTPGMPRARSATLKLLPLASWVAAVATASDGRNVALASAAAADPWPWLKPMIWPIDAVEVPLALAAIWANRTLALVAATVPASLSASDSAWNSLVSWIWLFMSSSVVPT